MTTPTLLTLIRSSDKRIVNKPIKGKLINARASLLAMTLEIIKPVDPNDYQIEEAK